MSNYNLGTAHGMISIDTSDLARVETNLRQTGRMLTSLGTGLIGGLAASVNAASDFETQISNVRAVTGATEDQIDILREAALKLGREGPFGPIAVTEAFVELSKAGLTATEIVDGAGVSVINLAKAADLDVSRAAEILANTMRTFQIPAAETARVIDLLAGAANQSTLDVEDLAVSLRYVGGIAAGLSIPIEDVSTALAQLGNAGIKGSTGGTSLRRILLNLEPATVRAQETMRQLGIITADGSNQFFDAAGHAKGLREVFEILNKSTANMTDQQRIATFNTLFGARASASAAILARDGAAGYDAMATSIGKVSAAEVAAARLDNLSGSIRKFKAALETALIGAGSPFLGVLQGFVDMGTRVIKFLDDLPGPLKTVILGGAALLGVISLLAGAFFLTLAPIVSAIRLAGQLGATMTAVRGAVSGLAGAFRAMGAGLLANPIFLVIAAIVALGIALYYLYTHSEAFRRFVDNLWQTIQRVWDQILGFFRRLPGYFSRAFDAVREQLSRFIGWVSENWDILLAILTGPVGIVILIWRRFGDDIVRIVSGAVDSVIGFFQNMAREVAGIVVRVVDDVVDFFSRLPGQVGGFVSDMVDRVVEFFSRLPYYFGYALGAIIGLFIRFHVEAFQLWFEWGSRLISAVIDFFSQLPGIIWGFLTDAFNFMVTFVGNMISAAIDLGTRFLAAVAQFFTQLPGMIFGFLTQALTAIGNFVSSAVTAAIDLGTRFIAAVVQFFSQLPGQVGNFMSQASDSIWNWGRTIVNTVITMGGDVLSAAWDFFSQLPSRIIEAIGDVSHLLWDIGRSIMTGLLDGLKSMYGGVRDFFGGIKDGITRWKGPIEYDKVMLVPAGRVIMQGLIRGADAQLGKVEKFFTGVSAMVANSMSGPMELAKTSFISNAAAPLGVVPSNNGGIAAKAPVTNHFSVENRFMGNFQVRDDRDALNISRFLAEETKRTLRAQGEQVITVGS